MRRDDSFAEQENQTQRFDKSKRGQVTGKRGTSTEVNGFPQQHTDLFPKPLRPGADSGGAGFPDKNGSRGSRYVRTCMGYQGG